MAPIFRRETALRGKRAAYPEVTLAELFHENTKLRRPMAAPVAEAGRYDLREMEAMARAYKIYRSHPQTPLPPLPADLVGPPIADVIAARRSHRNFSPDQLDLTELSAILQWSYGVTAEVGIPGGARQSFRAAPSAGALYPAEIYLAARAVTGLEPGIYHFEVPNASLALLERGDPTDRLHGICCGQDYARQAGIVLLITAVLERTKRKYGERGYRYVLLDIGHVAENLYLACTALGLAVTTTGAFFDDDAADLLGIDGCDEAVMYVAFVGKTDGGR